jgi:hypothetical protein
MAVVEEKAQGVKPDEEAAIEATITWGVEVEPRSAKKAEDEAREGGPVGVAPEEEGACEATDLQGEEVEAGVAKVSAGESPGPKAVLFSTSYLLNAGVDSVSSLEASGGVAAGAQKPGSSLHTTEARKKRKKKKKPPRPQTAGAADCAIDSVPTCGVHNSALLLVACEAVRDAAWVDGWQDGQTSQLLVGAAVVALQSADVKPRAVSEGVFEATVGELAVTGLRCLREAMMYPDSFIQCRCERPDVDGDAVICLLENLAECAYMLDPDGGDPCLRLATMLLVADPGKFAEALASVYCNGSLCFWHSGSDREMHHALFVSTA